MSESTPYHAMRLDEVYLTLGSEDGLSQQEAELRLKQFGLNKLPEPKATNWWVRFAAQFNHALIYILLAAATICAMFELWIDTSVILGVVVINAIIGVFQEWKAENTLEKIQQMLSLEAVVIRDNEHHKMPAEQLVPGDIILIKAGDKIPADARLIESTNLQTQEAALTGESNAIDKNVELFEEQAPIGDRSNMIFSGTIAVYGSAKAIVVNTGKQTEIGKITTLLTKITRLKTPLLVKMSVFGRWLTLAVLIIALFTIGMGYVVHQFAWRELFMAAIGLAVAAIPEGLPAVMTITLAIGVIRMAKRRAIIRFLPAVETMGSVTVICTDKTGTLTRNELSVQQVILANAQFQISGTGYTPDGEFNQNSSRIDPQSNSDLIECLRACVLCNDATLTQHDSEWQLIGTPIDGALLTLALKARIDINKENTAFPRTTSIPFDSVQKLMATLHQNQNVIFVKGAPEKILASCTKQLVNGYDTPLNTSYWQEEIHSLATKGIRVLSLAKKNITNKSDRLTLNDVNDLTMIGLVGLVDPPRKKAAEAVVSCQSAGIQVKMITGDHADTARAIAKEVNIGDSLDLLTGTDIDQLSDLELQDKINEIQIFARTTPAHKLRIVNALQSQGHVVAMTGDGVNDAPALKRADIGIAMGIKGTEAAKETADMVLADDNFATIRDAVAAGRTVYDNLKKAIIYILPNSGGEAMAIFIAVLLGIELPITPLQILWINMVTTVTLDMVIGFEPEEYNIMNRPPTPLHEPLLSRFLVRRIIFIALLFAAAAFGVFWFERASGSNLALSRTISVNTIVLLEIFYLLNCRKLYSSTLTKQGMFGNKTLWPAITFIIILQCIFTYAPFMQAIFSTQSLSADIWFRIITIGLIFFFIIELEKKITNRKTKT